MDGFQDFLNAALNWLWGLLGGLKDLLVKIQDTLANNPSGALVAALVLIVLTGLVGGMLADRWKQPVILGYILAGVFIGIVYKAGLGDVAMQSLDSLANIGVALLLFAMGLEFPKKEIKPIFKIAVWGALCQVLFTWAAATGLAYMVAKLVNADLFPSLASMLLFGACFVSTSTAVVLKTLSSRGYQYSLSGKVMTGVSIVQDLTVIPFAIIACMFQTLGKGGLKSFEPLLYGAIFMVLVMTLGPKVLPRILQFVAKRTDSKELFLLAVTGLALAVGAISEYMELSFSFGTFLAGIVLSDSEYGKKALSELIPIRDFFAMLFFVSIGMMLDASYLVQHPVLVLVLMILTVMTRTVFLSAVTWCSGYRNVIPVAMFFGMCPTSEIAFVVIQTGRSTLLFSDDLYSLALCVVVCSMIVGPLIDSLTTPVYALLRRTIWKKQNAYGDIELPPPDLNRHVIIAGGGELSHVLARQLTNLKKPYVIVEPMYERFREARNAGLSVIYGDPQHEVILSGAGIGDAEALLTSANDFWDNYAVVKTARKMNPSVDIVARADSRAQEDLLRDCSVQEIVLSRFEMALEMTRRILLLCHVPATRIQNYLNSVRLKRYQYALAGESVDTLAEKIRTASGLVELHWIQIPAQSLLTSKTIAESKVRSQTGVSIVSVIHKGEINTNPSPSLRLDAGDIVAMIGTPEQYEAFQKLVGEIPISDSAEDAKKS